MLYVGIIGKNESDDNNFNMHKNTYTSHIIIIIISMVHKTYAYVSTNL